MPDFAVTTAFKATDKISPAFNKMSKSADKFGRHGSKAFLSVSGASSALLGTMRGLLPIFGAGALIKVANDAIELASDLTEVQNVVDTTFGKSSKQIDKWAQSAIDIFGLSELQAKKFTGSLGAMMKSSGLSEKAIVEMSTKMTGLSGDFASFYNLPIEEAFDKIRAGISGETEPLKRLGINMSVANMEAFALTKNITKKWKAMTQAEQTTLRYNYLMKVSKDAQGDFNKTLATSYANQKRVLGVQFDQFLARMAVNILPALTEGFKSLNKIMSGLDTDSIVNGIKAITAGVIGATTAFVAYKTILAVTSAIQAAKVSIQMIQLARSLGYTRIAILKATIASWGLNTAMLANPIAWVAIGIGALVAGFILLAMKVGGVKNAFIVLGKVIMKALLFPVNLLIEGLKMIYRLMSFLPSKVGNDMGKVVDSLSSFQDKLNKPFEITEFDKKSAPNAAEQKSKDINFRGQIDVNAPQGTTVNSETRGARPVDMALVGMY